MMFMTSVAALADSNPTRAQLRLVVLGQWVRAGLDLARGARAGRGVLGGAVALWQVFQAIRLAIQLARRLSDLRGALSFPVPEPKPGDAAVLGSIPCSDESSAAACLRQALSEIIEAIRDALGLGRIGRPRAGTAAGAAAEPGVPPAPRPLTPPRERPPDRPPAPERCRACWRRSRAAIAWKEAPTPLAAPASGRLRLAAA